MKIISVINGEKKRKLFILSLIIIFVAILWLELMSFIYKEFGTTLENKWIFIIVTILYALIATIGILRFYFKKNKEILVIEKEGITDKELFGFIPWNDIISIKLYRYGFLKIFIGITLDIIDIEKKVEALPHDLRSVAIFNYKKGDPLIKIQGNLTPEIEKIYDLLNYYINNNQNKLP